MDLIHFQNFASGILNMSFSFSEKGDERKKSWRMENAEERGQICEHDRNVIQRNEITG